MKSEQQDTILWVPSAEQMKESHLMGYINWLGEEKNLDFNDYNELWEWSCANIPLFWETVVQYFDVVFKGSYSFPLSGRMPDCNWFEGAKLNYAEHLLRHSVDEEIAVIFQNEMGNRRDVSWMELKAQVAAFRNFLLRAGVHKGDRVVSYLPNIPEAVIAFIATASLGAIWSSCSPDFGVSSVIDRFRQIQPKVFICADGYFYNGKQYSRKTEADQIRAQLPTVISAVMVNYSTEDMDSDYTSWMSIMAACDDMAPEFLHVEFNDPLWILYSSGTTGIPKAITQSHGGILLEHLKYLSFHNDVKVGERFFWYTTTGWMMWNFLVGSLLNGATIVLYDGSPAYPDMGRLWRMAAELTIHHFGTSAPFIMACRKSGLDVNDLELEELRSIGSTGSPLPPEGFEYIYHHIHPGVWLCSMAGGTDVCTAFVGGNPLLPVMKGEIQCRALGVNLHAYNEEGERVVSKMGEMVIESPMPSMPIYFWSDAGKERYRSSYFDVYPGKWRHGDWIKINERGGLIIYGRSDATLNRHGIRIGTSEIYRSMEAIPEIEDSLIVNLELKGGNDFMPLFVKLIKGEMLSDELKARIKGQLKSDHSPRHVPDEIIQVGDIPYTISGKKLETPVKKILMGMDSEKVANREAIRNPHALDLFIKIGTSLSENYLLKT